jgi:peptide/nickel transport system substrate-binding protein
VAQPLRIGLSADPDLLDPTLGSSFYGRIVYAAMCDKLFDLDEKLNIVPQLATGYHYDDPTHLVLTLRPGVTFHDGEPLDAEAARYSLNRHLTLAGSMRAGEVNAIQSIEVVDKLTLRLTLKAPAAQLIAQLSDRAGIMMSPKAAEAAGRDFGLHPVCAGAFAFDSRVVQDRIVLKRFPAYWNAANIHFDSVTYRPFRDPSVRLSNLQAGAIDMVDVIAPPDIPAVRKDPKLKLAIGDGLTYWGITFNTDNGPRAKTVIGQDRLVRQAFESAIDRKALIDVVFGGLYTPVAQANSPSSPYYFPEIIPPPRDIDRAKALLKQAGVTLPVPVELMAANSPDTQQVAEVIQSMVAEAGFELKIKAMEFSSGLSAGYAGDFNAYLIGWSGRSDPDGNMWQMLHTGGAFNYGKYSTAAMDALLDDARKTADVEARRALYAKVWQEQRQSLPLIYLWIQRNVVGMRSGLNGFTQVPDGLLRLTGVTLQP